MTSRQTEIIQTAISLIAEKGIQGLTIKNLAKAIGISEPALYRHFENKTAILLALLNSFENITPAKPEIIGSEETTAIEKIHFVFQQYFETFSETPELVSVIFSDEIFKNDKQLSKKIAKIIEEKEELFLTIISEGQMSKNIRNDITNKHLTLMLMGSLRLLVKRWELNNYSFNLPKEGEKLFNSLKIMIKN
jgi:AcrR family transcriptional regulator